ncbi:hypothetical protein PIB30_010381 [Stylosanthes scabra]|uniref:Uncharacterized protein n=1 Tax=Stylosanthes scabra TaxID=79078 RepID=A0ABU6W440_9FABA|nr:hypothetical protein [Stylosanthes scabra]
MRQKAGVPSDGLPIVWPSLTSAPDLLRFQMNFSDDFFILPTSEPLVTSASVSRRYWPSLQRGEADPEEPISDGRLVTEPAAASALSVLLSLSVSPSLHQCDFAVPRRSSIHPSVLLIASQIRPTSLSSNFF